MLNQLVLVGRIKEIKEDKNIVLAVSRAYKNEEGIYETDLIPIVLSDKLFDNAKEFCQVNDVIGVKVRLETKDNNIIIIAERLTLLSNRKSEK